MSHQEQFLTMELNYMRSIRKTRNEDLLGVIPFAVERERQILDELKTIEASNSQSAELPLAAEPSEPFLVAGGGR